MPHVGSSGTAGTARSAAPEGLRRGDTLGRYVVLEKLGAGGMGIVLAAYDPELDRKVALKLVKATATGTASDEEARTRLLREAQAMARLTHPNVVAVHDVGTFGDRIFVAMELVDGQTLREWLKAAPPSWRDRLAVLGPAGRGLAAAHEKGILHRDFKPDNVMLAADGRVLVMDFGLARRAEPTAKALAGVGDPARDSALSLELTHAGAILGTPAYMAPEQFMGAETSPATDQFGFCVVLFEALFGVRPFAGESAAAIAFAVAQGKRVEPPADSKVPAWLRRIVVRGLAAEPAARWPDMASLLAALADDPTRRRRRWLGAGAGLTLIAGVIAAREVDGQRRRAECEELASAIAATWPDRRDEVRGAFSGASPALAAASFERVVPWLDAWAGEWSEARRTVCLDAELERERAAELVPVAIACLDQRRARFEALVEGFARADATTVIQAVVAASEVPRVAPCLDDAWLRNRPPMPDDPETLQAAESLVRELAGIRVDEAQGRFSSARDRARAAEQAAKQVESPLLHSEAEYLLGWSSWRVDGDPEAGAERVAAAWREAWAAGHDELAAEAAMAWIYLVGERMARAREGLFVAGIAEAMLERAGGDNELLRAELDSKVAAVESLAGNFDRAEELHERALRVRERRLGPDHPLVADSYRNRGSVHHFRGDQERAAADFERALAIQERALGPDHPSTAKTLNNLAITHEMRGLFSEALRLYERAMEINRRVYGPEHPSTATSLSNLGVLHWSRGAPAEAIAPLEQARDIWIARLGADDPQVGIAWLGLGNARLDLGEHAAALEAFVAAGEILHKRFGAEHLNMGYALTGRGEAELALGRAAAAIEALEQALKIRESGGGDPAELALTRFALARALAASGHAGERSLSLAQAAREVFAAAGAAKARELAEVEAWLAGR